MDVWSGFVKFYVTRKAVELIIIIIMIIIITIIIIIIIITTTISLYSSNRIE